MNPTYHERVAKVMSESYAAGTFNSYETILSTLLRHFPTEGELRKMIAAMEAKVHAMGAPADWHFIPDDPMQYN